MIRTIGIRREIMTDVYSDGYCADAAWPSPRIDVCSSGEESEIRWLMIRSIAVYYN